MAYASEYAVGKGLDPSGFHAERFIDYYASVGWKVGSKPMRDWRAAIRGGSPRTAARSRRGWAPMPTTGSRRIEDAPGFAEQMAAIRASKLRKAGLTGDYARADSARSAGPSTASCPQDAGRTCSAPWGRARHTPPRAACASSSTTGAGRGSSPPRGSSTRFATATTAATGAPWSGPRRIPLLALDDLGMERWTEWAVETLCGLVDERVKRGLPTVFTSNYALGDVKRALGGVEGIAPRVPHRGQLRAHRGGRARQEDRMPVMSQLRGLPLEKAELYGKPHGGARYEARWVWDGPQYERWWWDGILLEKFGRTRPSCTPSGDGSTDTGGPGGPSR